VLCMNEKFQITVGHGEAEVLVFVARSKAVYFNATKEQLRELRDKIDMAIKELVV
jgi:hypothetical protein